jgi:carbamoyl-phosphate synthase small subunit
MKEIAYLLLEDGSIFKGKSFGKSTHALGEVVFNTSMTGYQEMLTDPSYAGQIVVPTYPIIGNYGINNIYNESMKAQVSGFVVRQYTEEPSHYDSETTINDFLRNQNVPGIYDVDTRAITKRIRNTGVMKGIITIGNSLDQAKKMLDAADNYDQINFVDKVTTSNIYHWDNLSYTKKDTNRLNILVTDFGVKYNILRLLKHKNCNVTVLPAKTNADEILSMNPDGIMLSPGPGDPELLNHITGIVKKLIGRVPLMGICLGNQVLAKALGAKTYKLKFGHRGGNHPVKDIQTGKVYITAQNHGYSIDPSTLPSDVSISHISMNDGTVEGLQHNSLPAMSIQYHSEASPGPHDNEYIFDQFIEMVKEFK